MRKKLTKKFLMGLPEGAYLHSNVFQDAETPMFSEKVSPLVERNEQWKRIVECAANQRLCEVSITKREYDDQLHKRKIYRSPKLTKKYLMSLPEGVYLANVRFDTKTQEPFFVEKVAPLSERSGQWKRIVERGVNQRTCIVFETQAECEKYIQDTKKSIFSGDVPPRLTRQFLMGLREGTFIESGILDDQGNPVFAEKVSPLSKREEQWKKIVDCGANQMAVYVFEMTADILNGMLRAVMSQQSRDCAVPPL